MGNRANIIFTNSDESVLSPAIYLDWNGGAESIYAFLDEMDRRNIIFNDIMYESARFVQIVGDFFDQDEIGSLSLGITNGPSKITLEELGKVQTDNRNNGFYIIHRIKKGKRNIRRFKRHYNKVDNKIEETIEELTKNQVAKERQAARKHKYNVGPDSMAQIFIKIQGKREIQELL